MLKWLSLLSLFVLPWVSVAGEDVPTDPFEVRPLLPGMQAPSFELKKADGTPYKFDGTADKPMVLTFYRGGWCPYCNLHLAQMREAEPTLLEMGYEVVFISPDRPELLYDSLKEEGINYTLLSDSEMAAAKAFGIAFEVDAGTLKKYKEYGIDLAKASGEQHHLLPVPAVFLIGTDGVIQFQYVNPNYKVRLHPDVLLAAATVALPEAEGVQQAVAE